MNNAVYEMHSLIAIASFELGKVPNSNGNITLEKQHSELRTLKIWISKFENSLIQASEWLKRNEIF